MKENESLREAALTPEEACAALEKLRALLGSVAARNTMCESTSLRADAVWELLASLRCTLKLDEPGGVRSFLALDGETAYRRGVSRLRLEAERGRRLWEAACLTAPDLPNPYLRDTLRGFGPYWRQYDPRYGAHLVPDSIDYQLCRPVPERLTGAPYAVEYLRRLLIENEFLRRLDGPRLERLERAAGCLYLPDSLCRSPLAVVTALAAAGEEPDSLRITDAALRSLHRRLAPLSAGETEELLGEAAADACGALGVESPAAVRYLRLTAMELTPRVRAAGPEGLRGVFPALM